MRKARKHLAEVLRLSPSAKDQAVVSSLAERLRQDGLKLWFHEWVLKPGDSNSSLRSSRRESVQTSMPPAQRMSGLTSAAMREERIEAGLKQFKFGTRNAEFGVAQPGLSANALGSDWARLACADSLQRTATGADAAGRSRCGS